MRISVCAFSSLLVLAAVHSTEARAQIADASVYVDATAEDLVGSRLSYQVEQEISRSATLTRNYRDDDAALVVHLVTIAPDYDVGNVTYYSLVVNFQIDGLEYYGTSYAGFCGADILPDCARDIVSRVDGVRISILEALSDEGF